MLEQVCNAPTLKIELKHIMDLWLGMAGQESQREKRRLLIKNCSLDYVQALLRYNATCVHGATGIYEVFDLRYAYIARYVHGPRITLLLCSSPAPFRHTSTPPASCSSLGQHKCSWPGTCSGCAQSPHPSSKCPARKLLAWLTY